MSYRHQELELDATPERTREIVATVVAEIGWTVSEEAEGRSLVVRERPLLPSDTWPFGIRVSIADGGAPGRSSLRLWGRMAGFGPFVAERLKERMEVFAAGLRAASARRPVTLAGVAG